MRFALALGLALLTLCTLSCGGDEFSAEGTGGSSGSGAAGGSGGSGGGTGGSAGSGALGGSGSTGGALGGGGTGATGATGATGGSAGAAGSGGTGATGGSGGTGGAPTWQDCGPPFPGSPKFYTTLDDYASIQNPAVGDGTNVSANPTNDFHSGKCGSAILIDGGSEFVRFQASGNIDLKKGSLDFWFRPAWDKFDGKIHNLFATSSFTGGGIKIRKADDSNSNELAVYLYETNGASHKTSVSPDNYPLMQDQWTRITVFWSFDTPGPNVMLWFDKIAVQNFLNLSTGPKNLVPVANPSTGFFIGADGSDDPSTATGLIDDFKIYGIGLNPV